MNKSESLFSMTLSDGRRMAYAEVGDLKGKPLLLMNGSGAGRSHAYWFDAAARAAGVRLIVNDRPGYGHSDPRPDFTFLNSVNDVRELLDHLKIPRITIAAMSGGAGFALACGYQLSDRMERILLIGGMIPTPPEVSKKMSVFMRAVFWMTSRMPRLAEALLGSMRGGDPNSGAMKRQRAQMAPADRRLIARADMFELAYGEPSRDCFRQGMKTFVREMGLYSRPLGFDLSQVKVPVRVWHGLEDTNVIVDVARYAAASIPGAKLNIEPEGGHLIALDNPAEFMRQAFFP